MMNVTVFRFDSEKDAAPHYEAYQAPGGAGVMVLDVLNYIRENHDPGLRFRHSCHMGKCGSCAVMVNGKPGLACWELARPGMVVEPLRGFPVIADLVVERSEAGLQDEGLRFERQAAPPPCGQIERLTVPCRKEFDETRTCIGCNSCVSACPYVNSREKSFAGPRQMVEAARHVYDLRQSAKRPLEVALVHGVWDSVACLACKQVCPQEIDPRQRILDMRSRLMERPDLELPRQVRRLNESLVTLGNPYHYPASDKGKWAEGLGVKDLTQGKRADWLYFAGCTQSYDPADQAVARGLCVLFGRIGLDFGILGKEEGCCGDPAWATGETSLTEHIAAANDSAFVRFGINKVVTTCPHGFQQFVANPANEGRTIRHYTQVLAEAVAGRRLAFGRTLKRRVTYHDSCFLGRYNGTYDEPRQVLAAIPGLELVEMKDSREQALCCGGGGGGSFLEIKARPRLSVVRVQQALDAGADTIAVACPFCRTQLQDAVKQLEAAVAVKHVSELVAMAL